MEWENDMEWPDLRPLPCAVCGKPNTLKHDCYEEAQAELTAKDAEIGVLQKLYEEQIRITAKYYGQAKKRQAEIAEYSKVAVEIAEKNGRQQAEIDEWKDKTKNALVDARAAKLRHKGSNQCDRNTSGGCTACHFWSGAISALGDLVGERGIID